MDTKIDCIYCSCACNKIPHALDWGTNEIICYAACNAIHLYSYEKSTGGLHLQTLIGHKKMVTSVHWIKNSDNENELISTSADHTAAIWTEKESKFFMSSSLTGHTNVVRNATAIYVPGSEGKNLLVVTLSTDCTVKMWTRFINNTVHCLQTISLGNGFGLDVKLSLLPDTNEPVMILGADDAKIHIYTEDELGQFDVSLSLEGHEDWIQSLDIVKKCENVLMLASASQDCYLRIWKISRKLVKLSSDYESSRDLKVDEAMFSTQKGSSYYVSLESVLGGHENWIYSVRWYQSNSSIFPLQLLSTSMDKTMIIWEFDPNSNVWTEKIRVGEVGGNTLGFYGGVFSPCGEIIVAHGYQGAVHFWQLNKEINIWQPGLSFGGHYSNVQDIDWDPEGEYLISCSSDQTTRLHAPFVTHDKKNKWFEIARPQVHGYDMVCLSVLDRFKFISAGDEKVLRVFEAPRSFAETLENISKLDTSPYMKNKLAEGASVPSLGLSNKAVFQEDIEKGISSQDFNSERHPKDRYPDFYYTPTLLTAPPTEETLMQNTLWPETQKLYGHPYEVFTIASNHSKTLIASACKASKMEHAGIILWNTLSWRQVGHLLFHNLTITQLEFSPDDEYLLSVSRDRMWVIYKHFPNEISPYRKIANLDKKNSVHTRIIWSCTWTFDSLYFATSSRDKKVAVWGKGESTLQINFSLCLKPLEVEDSATAVTFAPCLTKNSKYFIAVGLENGCIILSTWCNVTGFNVLRKLDENIAHHLNVSRLKFSPVLGEAGSKQKHSDLVQLASCSNDHHTKIYNIFITHL